MWSIFTEEMIAHYKDTKSNTTTIGKRKKGFVTKRKVKLWQQGSLPFTTIIMEVLFLLAFHNLQGLHHNNWKKKKGFVTIVIENALKVINVLRRNYFT